MNPESLPPPSSLPAPTLPTPDFLQPSQEGAIPLSLCPLPSAPVPVFSRKAKPQAQQFDRPDLPLFFPVSRLKLVLMSIVTFGLYELYWFYQNWKLVKAHNPRYEIRPFWRAFFSYFFCHEMFSTILGSAEEHRVNSTFSPMTLTVLWIGLSVSHRLPDPFFFVALFAFIPLLTVQKVVNELNAIACPNHDPNIRLTALNIVGLVFGAIFYSLLLVSLVLPASE